MAYRKNNNQRLSCPPLEIIALLLGAGIDIGLRDQRGQTAMHQIVRDRSQLPVQGYLEYFKLLIKHGADPSVTDVQGLTILHQAAAAGEYPLVEMLIDAGVDVNARKTNGRTPLFEAVTAAWPNRSQAEVLTLRILLDNGADVAAVADDGWTALHGAVSNKRRPGRFEAEAVALLLERGADAAARDAFTLVKYF